MNKQNLRRWINELELSIATAKDCGKGEDTTELELSLANAREEMGIK